VQIKREKYQKINQNGRRQVPRADFARGYGPKAEMAGTPEGRRPPPGQKTDHWGLEEEIKNMTKIKDLPKIGRPREKLIQKGPENLKDEELLAILLGTGVEGKNVIEVSRQVLRKYSKKRLLKMKYEDLSKIKGIGPAKACIILAAIELVKRALEIGEETLPIIRSTKDVIAQAVYMREKTREHLMALFLNARNEMVYKKPMFIGTLNANLVHPREIFATALEKNAASVILPPHQLCTVCIS